MQVLDKYGGCPKGDIFIPPIFVCSGILPKRVFAIPWFMYIYIYIRVHDLLTSRSIFGAIINSQLPHCVTFKGSELCSNSNFSEFPWDVAKVVYPQWWVAPQTKTHSTMNWPKKSPLEVGWGFSRIYSFQKKKWPKIAWQCYALLGNDSRIQ